MFHKNDFDVAYKIAVFQKDDIIEKIYNIMSKITHIENGKKYLTYSNFDIITDLNDIYYKILNKIKNEKQIQDKIFKIELLERLENKLIRLFDITKNKYCASIVANEKDMKIKIINDIAQNNNDRKLLKDNYSQILNKVIKLYGGNITADKMRMKHKKEVAKEKQNKKLFNQIIWGHILRDISKAIPKGFSKGKGH